MENRKEKERFVHFLHVRQRINLHWGGVGLVDVSQACQGVGAVDVHGAWTADTLTATIQISNNERERDRNRVIKRRKNRIKKRKKRRMKDDEK
jgi:hypothetical protein